ncbi:MAG: hypothetical protein OXK21_08230, partial [Chloroflexota bacterium]|nr:hypothetical protein [Chloroflexota bacterium]
MKRALKIAVVMGMVTALGLLGLMPVAAQQPGVTVTRAISPASVAAGGEATVTITIAGAYGGIGSVVETLPAGFSYVPGSSSIAPPPPGVDGQVLSFALVGDTSFSYKVTASDSAGQHPITGELRYGLQQPRSVVSVSGDSSVTVATPSGVTATRAISPASVVGGGQVTVTITVAGAYDVGSLVETLPAGFSYVSGSSDIEPTVNGQNLSFSLLREASLSYKVTASGSAGQHLFTGQLTYEIDKTRVSVGGDSSVTVATPSGVTATRSVSPGSLPTGGGQATVTITIVGDYGGIGAVVETLPAGFSYVDGSVNPSDITPTVDGQQLSFSLLGETSLSYRVTTSAANALYN